MSRPDISPEALEKYRILFALRRMAPDLQSQVLADGAIVQRTGISVSNPVHLPDGIVLERHNLFAAFQKAVDGEPVPAIKDIEGVERDITLEVKDGTGILTYGSNRVAFPQAGLLSKRRETRQQLVADILKKNTLTLHACDRLQTTIEKPDYSEGDFFDARAILIAAPEAFATGLREKASKKVGDEELVQLIQQDFLPSETSHWDNLTAKRVAAENLAEFIDQELARERTARIADDPRAAVDVLSLTFTSPELVPLDAMRAIAADDLLAGLQRLVEISDPFALAGALEICADRATADTRFVEMGDAILDKLIKEPDWLRGEVATFSATFVLATAHLAKHETLQKQPVFWRRLAAASHAALVTRILGGHRDGNSSLLTWATRLAGKSYYLSVLNDAHAEPRWRPDWISPNFVLADIFGRLRASLQRLGENAPETWRKKIDDAESNVLRDSPPLAQTFPSVLQGAASTAGATPPDDTDIGRMYGDFMREPTVDAFIYFIPVVFAFGFAPKARGAVLKVVQQLRANLSTIAPEMFQAALDLAAMIAAQNRDVELGDAVSVVAVERLVMSTDVDRVLPTATILLQCAAAGTDRRAALVALARRLENVAYVSPSAFLPDAFDIFRILQDLNKELAPLLGRAVATARLGFSSGTAA